MRKGILFLIVTMSFWLMAAQGFAGDFSLTSPQFLEGSSLPDEQVLNGFGCSGGNISPELHWTGEPAGTKSFAVTVYDPDAPTGSGWWHWVVFDIPSSEHVLPGNGGNTEAGILPAGSIQSRTDFGNPGYGGACPSANDSAHHYQFTIWALDVEKLALDENASAAMVGFFLHQHQLDRAVLTAIYGR